ncbi:glycoside hydrolase family 16 protein [Thelonectria olida]|uniref:Glycoside hydrolase family 16 protein n=1 Tax=Thelonectria olida TaxID=1576542 RepID=A0A9P8W7W8_9HYPO|nr:glycoside hydrolase family 16 protein [Thelonectria olida]
MYWPLFLLIAWTRLVSGRCECGYSVGDSSSQEAVVFTDRLETDFSQVRDISESKQWVPQQFNISAESGRGKYGKSFMPSNVVTDDSKRGTSLGLRVGSEVEDGAVSASEMDTARRDLHYGSYRAGMKLTAVNGTCAAFFWYFNDTQEIDIEFLSREFRPAENIYPVNLVIQSKESRAAGFDASKTGTFKRSYLTFDPTADFHEYRFDYMPDEVIFYADSQRIASMNGSSVPSVGGHLILQHWSNGNDKWSGGPPIEDATVRVSYVKAYFNSSEEKRQATLSRRCRGAETNETVCMVPDGRAEDASSGGEFLGNDEDNAAGRLIATVVAMVIFWTGMYVFMGVGM